jgi:diguanylate cyclase (GGDEF)-like protein
MREPWAAARGWRPIVWPSAVAALLPFLLLWLPGARWHYGLVAAAGALTLVIAIVAVTAPWERLPSWAPSTLAFAYLGVVLLLRTAGGPSGVTAMVLLPVFWVGLCGTRRQLWGVLTGVTLIFVIPMILVGGANYPASAWRTGILFLVLAGIVGTTMHALVARVSDQDRARDRLLRQLDDLAHTDALTGLLNRRAWQVELDLGLARAQRTEEPVSVALVDIDSFKAINDVHGHHRGDLLLVDIARRWAGILGPDDMLARIGGDEFAVLLPDCTEARGHVVLARLRAQMPAPHTCSVGIAMWDGVEPADRLMVRADDALYDDKRTGQDHPLTARVSSPDLRSHASSAH